MFGNLSFYEFHKLTLLEMDILRWSEWLLYFCSTQVLLGKALTSLRKQLDITLKTLGVIREKLQNCNGYPPCCLTFHKDNQISCDILGPMPEKAFLIHCEKCKKTMKELLDCMYKFSDGNWVYHKKRGRYVKRLLCLLLIFLYCWCWHYVGLSNPRNIAYVFLQEIHGTIVIIAAEP